MKQKQTPLYIWAWVGGLTLLLQLLVHMYCHNVHNTDKLEFDALYEEMKEDFQLAKNGEFKVAFVGSSLSEYGIECPDEIYAYASLEKGFPIQFNKIYASGDPFQRLVKSHDILNKLLAIKPDLVLFQFELPIINLDKVGAAYKADSAAHVKTIQGQLEMRSNLNKRFIREMLGEIGLLKGEGCKTKNGLAPGDLDTLNVIPEDRQIRDISEVSYAWEGFEALEHAGIKVVFTDIPKPHALRDQLFPPAIKTRIQEQLSQYQKKFGIEYWPYDGIPMTYKYYWDYSHLTAEGRTLYTHWLVEKIIAESKD